MKKIKRKKGYIFIVTLIIFLVLTSVTMLVTMLGRNHSENIMKDANRSKSYYISKSGLEMVYSALNDNYGGSPSLIAEAGNGEFGAEKEKIIEKKNLKIRNKNKTAVLGYADIYVDLKYIKEEDSWYYRIVSKGKIHEDDKNNKPTDMHTLTMFVFKDEANSPKIYEGDKKTI